ncbi:hypothetical protein HZH68_006225 [Vespula germanica]|uniref:Uncharacterized protein n=1 Tax=Vespula germanica TaxID=30212 RepID=A0A834KB14_VESGE|nr:hypothetical protein HZH68_006225 [Vespula germanica]
MASCSLSAPQTFARSTFSIKTEDRYAVLAVPATAVKILSQITIIQNLPFFDCCVKCYNLGYGILSFLLSYSLALTNDNDNDKDDDDDDDDDNDDKEESCILFPCERYAVDNELALASTRPRTRKREQRNEEEEEDEDEEEVEEAEEED